MSALQVRTSVLQGCDLTDESIAALINYGQNSVIQKAAKQNPPIVRGSDLDGWLNLYVKYFVTNLYPASRDVLSHRLAQNENENEVECKCGAMSRGILAWGAQTRLAKELLLRDAIIFNQNGEMSRDESGKIITEQDIIHRRLAAVSSREIFKEMVVAAQTAMERDEQKKRIAIIEARKDFKERSEGLPSPHSFYEKVSKYKIHRFMQERIVEAKTGMIHMDANIGTVHTIMTDFMRKPITDDYKYVGKTTLQQQPRMEQSAWQQQVQQQQQQCDRPNLKGYAAFDYKCQHPKS